MSAPVRCPTCGEVAFMWGPRGALERKCWGCGHVWTPTLQPREDDDTSTPATVVFGWSGTIVDLVEGLASGKPMALTMRPPVVAPTPYKRPWPAPIPSGTRVTIERVDDVGYSGYAVCQLGKSLGIGLFASHALALAWSRSGTADKFL